MAARSSVHADHAALCCAVPCCGGSRLNLSEMQRQICETLQAELRDLGITIPGERPAAATTLSKKDKVKAMLGMRRPMHDPAAAVAQ